METKLEILAIAALLTVTISVLIGLVGHAREKRDWNNGFCPVCKMPWKIYDTDSQVGRGYKCGCKNRDIWITWDDID